MILTKEQEDIIHSGEFSFKINAVAGSGKQQLFLNMQKKIPI